MWFKVHKVAGKQNMRQPMHYCDLQGFITETACLDCYRRTLQGIFCILQAPETQNEQNNIPALLLLISCFNYRPTMR